MAKCYGSEKYCNVRLFDTKEQHKEDEIAFTYLQQPSDWQQVFLLFSSCVFLEDKIYEAWSGSE